MLRESTLNLADRNPATIRVCVLSVRGVNVKICGQPTRVTRVAAYRTRGQLATDVLVHTGVHMYCEGRGRSSMSGTCVGA